VPTAVKRSVPFQQGDSYAKSGTDSVFSSIYGKFRAQAPRLSDLIRLLEAHAASADETPQSICREYESALADCRAVYIDCRRQLVRPEGSFQNKILSLQEKFVPTNKKSA
jgi:hypothetical protein